MDTIRISDELWEEIKELDGNPDHVYCKGHLNEQHAQVAKPGHEIVTQHRTGKVTRERGEDCLLVTLPSGHRVGVAHLKCEKLVRYQYPGALIQRIQG